MKPELILQADILDIIFEGRNKEYGAYNLRKGYNHRMIKAMTGALFISVAFCTMNFISFSSDKSVDPIHIDDDIELVPVDLKKQEPLKAPEVPKTKMATVQSTTPVIVDQDVVEPIPDIKKLAGDVIIGTTNIDGPPASSSGPTSESSEKGTAPAVEAREETPKVFWRAEFMPEFPGGHDAFMKFLSRHLRVPEESVEPGQKIKIIVQFVVGKDGELSDIQFLQTSGEVFEQEVVRVMKKMPRWKPGMQNGEKVAVYFKLPVVFETHDE